MPVEKKRIGPYDIIRPIGSGGTAQVYLGTSPDSPKPVAIKTSLDLSPGEIRQFIPLIQKEFSLIKGHTYPGLVRVLKLHIDDLPQPCLIMEYCPETTLDQVDKIENIQSLLNVLSSISVNLYYLKIAGLYHGDLKPHNVFLSTPLKRFQTGGKIYTRISDFSLAFKNGALKNNRLGLGTVGYIAPETIDKDILDHQSDLFALGIIGYTLATGRHPFMEDRNDPVRINSRVKEYDPPAPIELNPDLPNELSQLIVSMLAKAPESRPDSAWDICRKLETIGATLSYKSMIRPKHVLQAISNEKPSDILAACPFELNERERNNILKYTGTNEQYIRHYLEINFNRYYQWNDLGRIEIITDETKPVWPCRMQRWQAELYTAMSVSSRKKAILCTVAGNLENAVKLQIINQNEVDHFPLPLITYLQSEISKATYNRFNETLARLAVFRSELYLAAELYARVGNIDDGYSPAMDSAQKAINNGEYEKAGNILETYIELCRQQKCLDRQLQLLKYKADLSKRIGNVAQAASICQEIIDLYKGRQSDKFLAEVFKELGDLYKMKQDYNSGIKALRQAEKVFYDINDQLELSHTLNNIGNIYWIDAKYDEAYDHYRRAFKIQKKLSAINDVASTLSNMGSIFFYRERYDRAINLFKLSLRLKRLEGSAVEVARTLNNLGYVYSELGSLQKAIECLEESRQLNEEIGNKKELLYNLENLTQVMLYSGRLRDSIDHLKQGLHISETLEDQPHQGAFLRGLGTVQKRLGYYGQALQSMENALSIGKATADVPHQLLCLIQQGDLYYRLNILGSATKVHEELVNISEQIDDRRARISAIVLQSKIDSDYRHLDEAVAIASELKLTRSLRDVYIQKIELALKHNDIEMARDSLEDIKEIFDGSESDLETPHLENLRGALFTNTNELSLAEEHLKRAHDLAQASALLPEMIEISYNLGRLNALKKDYEQAFGYYKQAIGGFKKIADDIENNDIRQAFMMSDLLISLGSEIKSLNSVLT